METVRPVWCELCVKPELLVGLTVDVIRGQKTHNPIASPVCHVFIHYGCLQDICHHVLMAQHDSFWQTGGS